MNIEFGKNSFNKATNDHTEPLASALWINYYSAPHGLSNLDQDY